MLLAEVFRGHAADLDADRKRGGRLVEPGDDLAVDEEIAGVAVGRHRRLFPAQDVAFKALRNDEDAHGRAVEHVLLCLGQVARLLHEPHFLRGPGPAHELAAERGAVLVDRHHGKFLEHFIRVGQRIEAGVDGQARDENQQHALVGEDGVVLVEKRAQQVSHRRPQYFESVATRPSRPRRSAGGSNANAHIAASDG